jgi:excisionase family DNA binding protein
MDKLPDRLSIAEARDLLAAQGVKRTKEAIRKRIKAGDLPAEKIGSQWTIAKYDLEAYAETLDRGAKGKGT